MRHTAKLGFIQPELYSKNNTVLHIANEIKVNRPKTYVTLTALLMYN